MNTIPSPLLIVTSRTLCAIPLEQHVERLFAAGARWLWFRDKDLPFAERKALALQLKAIVERSGGTFTVGGDITLADDIAAKAAHVSTPEDALAARLTLGAQALIGMSAHSQLDVASAKKAGADYVTLSPVYPTSSKPGYGPALGPQAITAAAKDYGLPVVALGGIGLENMATVRTAGAAAVAIMGLAMATGEPETLMHEALNIWNTGTSPTAP